MTEHPIVFKGDMVAAILDGRKMQTRRIAKAIKLHDDHGLPQWDEAWVDGPPDNQYLHLPYGTGSDQTTHRIYCRYEPGDLFWAKRVFWQWGSYETLAERCKKRNRPKIRFIPTTPPENYVEFLLKDPKKKPTTLFHLGYHKRSPLFMPKKFARLWLKVKSVRVERVQEISENAAILEGTKGGGAHPDFWVGAFRDLWDSINKSRGFGWDENPWVWVVEFERTERRQP